MARFDHPLVFALVTTVIVVSMMWLLSIGFKALGWSGGAAFIAGPTSVES